MVADDLSCTNGGRLLKGRHNHTRAFTILGTSPSIYGRRSDHIANAVHEPDPHVTLSSMVTVTAHWGRILLGGHNHPSDALWGVPSTALSLSYGF